MSSPWNDSLYEQSAQLLRSQLPAHILWVCICILTLHITVFILFVMISWKPLRQSSQALIYATFANDAIQSVLWNVVGIKRLYLAANYLPELTSQFICMLWLIGINLTDFSSNFIVLSISVDRLLAVCFPFWYIRSNKALKIALIAATPPLSIGFALLALIDTNKEKPNLACTASQSFSDFYDRMAAAFENGVLFAVIAISLLTCLLIFRRYLYHMRLRSNMSVFKREVELQVATRLGVLVLTFLISQGASSIFVTLIRKADIDDARKAALGPLVGCLHMCRGLLDSFVYLGFCKEYRKASQSVIYRIFKGTTSVLEFQRPIIAQSETRSQPVQPN